LEELTVDDEYAELFKKLPGKGSSDATWQDVVAELGALGRTFGDVVRNAWQGQDNDAGLGQLRETLDAMIAELNKAVAGTPQAEQAREQLVHLSESIRAAAERTSEELRPELLSMLRQANAEIRRLTRLDDEDA
jgi:hypothetical protein